MLSVLYMESADALAHIIRFYCPDAPVLLDVTHGTGTMTKKCPIPVVGVDIDPNSKAEIIADSTSLPLPDSSFDAAVFDPPYLYGSHAMHMGPIGKKTWAAERTTWKKPQDLISFSAGIGAELSRVLRPGGKAIVKIMNSRLKGDLIRNDQIITDAFGAYNLKLQDQVVYVRTVTGSFPNPKSAQMAHGFWLIFKRVV